MIFPNKFNILFCRDFGRLFYIDQADFIYIHNTYYMMSKLKPSIQLICLSRPI